MIRIFTALLAVFITISASSQLNMQQLGYMNLPAIKGSNLSDIWGYVDEDGNEYAIVGLHNGTVIVDVTNPANPVEVFFQPGGNSIWRDIKTWGNYAYVTTEAQDGLLIIDLSPLPGSTALSTVFYTGPAGNPWQSAHNLYIDENGVCYIFGANRGNGGCIMLDLTQNPVAPVEIGTYDNFYIHDGVARGDTLYAAHVSNGFCNIVNVSNKTNPLVLASFATPNSFSHNIWMSDDGDYVYTTDEVSGAFLGEFNVSNLNNVIETDRIRSNPGTGTIPHNVHFINDFIVTSYYRDGVTVHDVSDKGNMVLVGEFDTSPLLSGNGFNGCWGVYPWLPSGNIIAADIERGLYILSCTYERAAYLHGTVTDITNGNPINNATIELVNTEILNNSLLNGDYKTGIGITGTYDVIFSHPFYVSDTIYGVTLTMGNITIQDAQLEPKIPVTLIVHVEDAVTNLAIPGAMVEIVNPASNLTGTTDAAGNVTFSNFYENLSEIFAGKWGYITECNQQNLFGNPINLTVQLNPGYYDDFHFDFGWMVSGNAPAGMWELADPIGVTFQNQLITPSQDMFGDCGVKCYVTGNNETTAGSDDVDIGNTILESPIFDLSTYSFPQLSFYRWWVNAGGNGNPNDSLQVYLDNGIDRVRIMLLTSQDFNMGVWKYEGFHIVQHIALTSTMKLILETADWQVFGGHLVEAGIDIFRISEFALSVSSVHEKSLKLYPQPNTGTLTLSGLKPANYLMQVFDLTGKLCIKSNLNVYGAETHLSLNLSSGTYVLSIQGEEVSFVEKLIIK
ncbi:MAG: choice-of-anchor B family protein [Flavobacteriales bacterium]